MLGGKYLPSIVYKFRMLNFNQCSAFRITEDWISE
jgi:hypothetical protein